MEVVKKGIYCCKTQTFEVDNVRIMNVVVPRSEAICHKYNHIAEKIIKKCGVRSRVTYYPIPPEIAIKKKLVPSIFYAWQDAVKRFGRGQ